MQLVLNKKGWHKFPWEKAAPYNKDDLIVFLSRNTAVVFKNIRSETDGIHFSISQMMTHDSYKHIFGCTDFTKSLKSFASLMDTRLERYFITKKCEYIFFDKEEQKALKDIISGLALDARIDIMRRKTSTGNFETFPLMFATQKEYSAIRNKLLGLGIEVSISIDEYMRYASKYKAYRGVSRDSRENQTLEEIFKEFPNLKTDSKDSCKKAYREYSKQYHPDTHPDDKDAQYKFARLTEYYEKLQETTWYTKLQ